MSGKLVLVSGASGYLGSHCVKNLQEAGYRVRGTVRSLKNEQKVKYLYNLCPGAQYPVELVEADLSNPDGWPAAVAGCNYVLHTASPFFAVASKDADKLIRPAVDGTLNVLRAVADNGNVQRVVLTSSFAAIEGRETKEGPFSEKDWSVPEQQSSMYNRSKTLAEQAAWNFLRELPHAKKFELCVMNPVSILGPTLSSNPGTSVDMVIQLMEKKMPAVPKFIFPVVDVRDVAEAHTRALTNDGAVGQRHLLWSENAYYPDIAKWLDEEFKGQGYKVPTCSMPDTMVRMAAVFNTDLKEAYSFAHVAREIDNTRFKSVLGRIPIPARKTTIDMGYSLVEFGLVRKTDKYAGSPDS